jgi:hypothetical protein
LHAMRERKTFVLKTDRPGVRFLLTKSRVPDQSMLALIGAASIQALPLSFVKPILTILAQEQEEAISFGPLYERANVSCSMV